MNSDGWAGFASSGTVTIISAIILFSLPSYAPVWVPTIIINFIFTLSPQDWNPQSLRDIREGWNKFLHRLFPTRRLHHIASLLVAMAALSAQAKGMDTEKIVAKFFSNSTINVGASNIDLQAQEKIETLPEDWRALVSDSRFPAILKKHVKKELNNGLEPDQSVAMIEALCSFGLPVETLEGLNFDVVLRIKEGENLSKAKRIYERAKAIQSFTILADSPLEESRINGEVTGWHKEKPLTVFIHDQGLFMGQTIVMRKLRDSLPAFLRPSLSNVLLLTFERMDVDNSGIGKGSDLYLVKLMVLNEILKGVVMTLRDQLLVNELAKALIVGRQA
jgi:hypothetical protein